MRPNAAMFLVFTVLCLQSCKKDYCIENKPDHTRRLTSVKNYHIDGTYYTVDYKYNSKGQLENEKQIGANNFDLFETFFHYQNSRLEVEEMGTSPKIAEFRYRYKDHLLSETEYVEFVNGP